MIIRKLIISAIDNRCRLEDERKENKRLKIIAEILRYTSDGDFCVARYGGDEFVFMAYDVSEEKVRDFLNRLVENIRNEAIAFEAKPDGTDKVTISAGAIIQQNASEDTLITDLLKQADKILYEVKQAGKDGYMVVKLQEAVGDVGDMTLTKKL